MRKTTIPVAVVLAASAVPMQAQEAANYTKESLSKSVGDLMQVINNYPTEVKNTYSFKLSEIQAEINGLGNDPTQEELDKIAAEIQEVAKDAAAAEKDYADARDAANKAMTDAETAKSNAATEIEKLVVPSVKDSYQTELRKLATPEMPSDDKLYNDIELAKSTKDAWDAYKSSIESLVAEAKGADKAEQDAQPGRKTTLEDLVASVKVAAEAALPIIQGYWNYAEGDANATAIKDVIRELPGISEQIDESLKAWALTEAEATKYNTTLSEKQGAVTASAEDAKTAAQEAAQADAEFKVKDLTPYEEPIEGNDDNIIAAKEAVNAAIASAKAKAKEVAAALDKAPHESLAAELDKLVADVAPAQSAVTAAENNYTAYQSLVTKYNELKLQYDESAIDLSTLKANGKIDEQLYNAANGKLNVVAQNLQNLFDTNKANYDDKKYEGGTSDEDYTAAVALLGNYTTVGSIAQIVNDATNLNTTLESIEAYQTRVDAVVVIVKSEKYSEQADTLTSELTEQKATVTGLIANLEADFRANNALNSENDAVVKAAVAALENAATKAVDDMQAYEKSKETLAGWTNSVDSILGKIILDEKFNEANSTAYNALATAKTQAESIKSEIEGLESNVEGAFAINDEHPERSSQATLSIINDKDYDFETLGSTVDTNMKTYNTWLNEQGDVAAYELGLKYVYDLNNALVAAKKATADDALGYDKDKEAIDALETAIKAKHGDEKHEFNDCIAELSTWSKTNDSITTSINNHKTAWEANKTAYTEKMDSLNAIKGLDLYVKKLNDTNKATVDSAIDAALNDLDGKNGEQKAAEYDAATAVSTIQNSIAQKVLLQELDAADITTALDTARDSVTTNVGWNPSNYYTGLLDGYKTTADTFTEGVELEDYATKSAEIATLKSNIEAVPTKAKDNYTAYQSQTAKQTAAKADWAKIYSSVGATYGDQFAGAQKLYQDSLNVCFTVLTGYDTDIETRYNNGTSVEFGTEAYDQAIAENKAQMLEIEKNAKANKNAYDLQAETLTALNTSYTTTAADLVAKLKEIVAAIATAEAGENVSDEDKEALQQQKTDLEGYQAELETVNSNIEALAATALEKVNAGESFDYALEFGTTSTAISTEIGKISSEANGTYNENVVAHNKVIKQLFDKAYSDAKAVYHQLVLDLEKYAGYKHALPDGKSAYAEEIAKANQTVFSLNTQLVNEYAAADSVFTADTKEGKYTDKGQAHKANVNSIKTDLENAYSAFLEATQVIATVNNYAKRLSDLKTAYENALADVEDYTYSVDALKKFEGIDGGKLNADYETALADNKGPQVLDELLALVESLQNSVTNAYNEAANVEADSTIKAVQIVVDTYKAMTYPTTITNLSDAVAAAVSAIDTAGSLRDNHYRAKTLPGNLDTILADLSGIETSLSNAKDAAEAAVSSEKAALQQEGGTWYKYNTTIVGISTAISGYENGKYAAKLSDLIATAKGKVNAATTANNNALDVLYENGTGAVDTAIVAAQDALQDIKDKVADLQANTPAGIVAALLKDAQALVPLYNRAEANAKGNSEAEKECKDIYTVLTSLLATLQPDKNAEGYNETLEGIAAKKDSYDKQISKLKERIIAADLEQEAYNELLASLAVVKDSLDGVKATIAASKFVTDLQATFGSSVNTINTNISAKEQNINIDHANNLCGKETATVKAEDIETISASIKSLSEEVKTKETALAKAEADNAKREANTSKYNNAITAIGNVKNKLGKDWLNAQTENPDVYTLFYDEVGEEGGETGLYGQIASLYSSLETAYAAAQNVVGDPSELNTETITSSVNEISLSIDKLMSSISKRQAQYVTDVTTLNTNIKEMEANYADVVISDIAAADKDVQDMKAKIDAAIADIDAKMKNFGPNDTKTVQDLIDAVNAQIDALKDLAAGKTYIPGDIDSDGKVDVLDLALIRDLVSGKTDSSSLDDNQQKAADMDGDGEYTVADFVQVNNVYVYGNKLGQNVAVAKAAMKNQQEPGSVAMQMDTANMDVMLNSTVGYAAIQMDVTLPEGVSITEVEFSGESKSVMMTANMLDNGACRLMLYTVNSSNLLNGENRLLNLKLAGEGTGVVSIDRIIASTGSGQRHDLESVTGAYTIVTGIEAVEASEASKTSIFDINGMVRKTMQKGVNIVKDAAGKVKKILVK